MGPYIGASEATHMNKCSSRWSGLTLDQNTHRDKQMLYLETQF